MIAIPNMEKPKKGEVIAFDGEYAVYTDDDMQVHRYPLIDIVRCGERKRWVKDGNDSFGYAMFCEHDCSLGGQGIKKPTDFCSYGERRADEE